MKAKNYLYFDIILIAIVYLVGIIGIYFLNSQFFLKTSFVSILIPLFLFCYRSVRSLRDYILFFLIFLIGYFAEFLGVNYQILFGKYAYGETLGIKIYGVSLIIGLNWLLLAVTTRAVVTRFINNNWIIVLLASLLMVGIDYLIEPVAPTLDFWRFEENPVPFSNYRDWFFVAVLMQYVLSFQQSKSNMFYWSLSFIIILLLFFSFFHLTIV